MIVVFLCMEEVNHFLIRAYLSSPRDENYQQIFAPKRCVSHHQLGLRLSLACSSGIRRMRVFLHSSSFCLSRVCVMQYWLALVIMSSTLRGKRVCGEATVCRRK